MDPTHWRTWFYRTDSPEAIRARWEETFGVELLDGLGTAEQWHVFLSHRPGRVRPGTLGEVVPGFDVRVRDDEGRDLPDGDRRALGEAARARVLAAHTAAHRAAEFERYAEEALARSFQLARS